MTRLLHSPILWLAVVAVVGVSVFLVVRSRQYRSWGFRDLVKNPALWDQMARSRRETDLAAAKAKGWNDDQVAAAVEKYLFRIKGYDDAAAAEQALRALGARTHPAVLRILGDRALGAKLVKPAFEERSLLITPFDRACKLLGDSPPAAATAVVAPFLDDPSADVRGDAAWVLGKIGTAEVVPLLRKALADPDRDVQGYALMGLEFSVKDRLSEACRRELYGDLQKILIDGENSDHAARLLLAFDRERAMAFFLSEAVFTPQAPSLHEVLEALAEAKAPVPREPLRGLIGRLETRKLKYPHTWALSSALQLLGRCRAPDDRALLTARMEHPERKIAEGAAAGLLASHGLEEFRDRLGNMLDEQGYDALSVPQRYYFAVSFLDMEVNNGGLDQYFVNSSGNHWRDAAAGLAAMGFVKRAAAFKKAVAKFGANGPSEDRRIRQDQLADLATGDEAVFGTFDRQYGKSGENFEVLSARYVLDHAEAFR